MNRLKILDIQNTCTGCGACAGICPKKSLSMQYDNEGFIVPVFDQTFCIDCRLCEEHCHVINPEIKLDNNYKLKAFACWSLDEKERMLSSSGGMYSVLSNKILSLGGVVFGARYNFEQERLEHNHTDNFELAEFRKSKYIESNTLSTFSEVRSFLRSDRWVLYCGTPCQISGLRSFLRHKEYAKLILVDFICHGVPSNLHFTEYKRSLEKKKGNLNYLDFRPKTHGWHYFNFGMGFVNGKKQFTHYSKDIYYLSFVKNDVLRRSCYNCSILENHLSDITLADFWKIHSFTPELDDNKGVSLLVSNSLKGETFLNSTSNKCYLKELPDRVIALSYLRNNASYSLDNREKQVAKIKNFGYVKTMQKKYGRKIMITKLKDLIKKIIRRK